MARNRLVLSSVLCAFGAAAFSTPAIAAVGIGALPMAVAASVFAPARACPVSVTPASGPLRQDLAAPATSKMAALLGGQPSALERIAQQQAQPVAPTTPVLSMLAALPLLEPAAGPFTRPRDCAEPQLAASSVQPLLQQAQTGLARKAIYAPEDFLASKRLAIRHTAFDGAWNRVRRDNLPQGMTSKLATLGAGAPGEGMLSAVNAWANAKIRYVEDRELYGKADYWASARETMRKGAGDCEDIAIAKMQLLAGLGVSREAMYLTIARDLVRGADHAVLVVQMNGKSWMLDNATDRVLDASQSYDYRPVMSFSTDRKWLHGY